MDPELPANSPAMPSSDGGPSPPRRLVFAFYLTGHGFGHATRAIEVPPLPSQLSSSGNFDQHDLISSVSPTI
jgi:hypothetical protein